MDYAAARGSPVFLRYYMKLVEGAAAVTITGRLISRAMASCPLEQQFWISMGTVRVFLSSPISPMATAPRPGADASSAMRSSSPSLPYQGLDAQRELDLIVSACDGFRERPFRGVMDE